METFTRRRARAADVIGREELVIVTWQVIWGSSRFSSRDSVAAETPARAACVFYLRRASILTSPLHVKVSPEEKSKGPTWIKSIKESLFVSKNNGKAPNCHWNVARLLLSGRVGEALSDRWHVDMLTCQQRESPSNFIDFNHHMQMSYLH